VTVMRGRRRKQLLENVKENRGFWILKVVTQDRTLKKLLSKNLWTTRKTDCRMSAWILVWIYCFYW